MNAQQEIMTRAAGGYDYWEGKPMKASPDIRNCLVAQEHPAETILFHQGSKANEVYLIEKGLVKLICLSQDGKELIVSLRSAGELLGAAPVIVKKAHPVAAVTLTKCQLIRIPPDFFSELARTDPQFCWHLHQVHCDEIYNQASQLVALRYLSARQRFEHMLWKLISAMEPDISQKHFRLHMPLKYSEIARLIGVTAEHLSRVLKQMEDEGVISRQNGTLTVFDRDELYHPDDSGETDMVSLSAMKRKNFVNHFRAHFQIL